MMLQSNEDKIRVFAAIPSAWDTTRIAFTLLARGAFLVSAERNEQAEVTQIGIKSLKGNICKIQNPWKDKKGIEILQCNTKQKINFKIGVDDVISFVTKADTEYVISKDYKDSVEKYIYSGGPNMKVKLLGSRILGKLSGWNEEIDK